MLYIIKSKCWSYGLITLAIVSVIFISGCIQQQTTESGYIPINQENYTENVGNKCTPTGQDVEGPFYLQGVPFRSKISPQDSEGENIIIISGKVLDSNCNTISNALIDVWQTDSNGKYDMSTEFWYRGKLKTGVDGTYQFETIKPGNYPSGNGFRPAHIHIKVLSSEHKLLTTQIYFKGDPYLAPNDACGSGCRSDDKTHIIDLVKENNYWRGNLDIVLSNKDTKTNEIKTYGSQS